MTQHLLSPVPQAYKATPPPPAQARPIRLLRICYIAGAGDVINTFRQWRSGKVDETEVAVTYSEQFYDACRELASSVYVVGWNARREVFREPGFTIEHRPMRFAARRGIRYHLGMLRYMTSLLASCARFRPDVVIASAPPAFMLSPLALLGICIVPSLHSSHWPAGYPPCGRLQRLLLRADAWFWRHLATATIAVSPECERQIRQLAGNLAAPVLQVRAQYRPGYFDQLSAPPANRNPLHVMYAGRIAAKKGVFDLLAVAAELARRLPGRFVFELCGDGPDLDLVRKQAGEFGLQRSFLLLGQLDRNQMAAAYGRSHVVVVPTNSHFAEGLNKVSVEGVLAGRPVLTSRLSNALDVLGDAIVEVPPDDPLAYAEALVRLAQDDEFYQSKSRACRNLQAPFYDRRYAWGTALRQILAEHVLPVDSGHSHALTT